jgi:hypothetical protein
MVCAIPAGCRLSQHDIDKSRIAVAADRRMIPIRSPRPAWSDQNPFPAPWRRPCCLPPLRRLPMPDAATLCRAARHLCEGDHISSKKRARERNRPGAGMGRARMRHNERRYSPDQRFEYVISTVCAAGVPVYNVRSLLGAMAARGQPLYGCQTPDGYRNTEAAWLSPAASLRRISFALALAPSPARGPQIGAILSAPLRPDPHLFLGNQVSVYGTERKEMWTKAHRARHEARLKEMVTVNDADGNGLAIAVVPASVQDRDTLPAFSDRGTGDGERLLLSSGDDFWRSGAAGRHLFRCQLPSRLLPSRC